MNRFKRFFGHLKTIMRHRYTVVYHSFKAGVLRTGIFHDLSKYSPSEFWTGVKYFAGNRSPNELEREDFGYSVAWLHHKGRNKHHFEYWTDYNPIEKKVMPVKMPIIYVKEMFCDRVAASKIYQGKNYTENHPIEYFLRGKDRRFIHPETSSLIENLLRMLSEKGEKETFRYIRNLKEY